MVSFRPVLAVLAACTIAVAAPAAAGPSLLVHGNYCGPGDAGGPAVDQLDAACMRHDACYDSVRLFDCGCDLAFMDELRRMSWPSEALYQKGRAVYEAIALVPCVGTAEQQKSKIAIMRNDHIGAVARGREAPDAALGRLLCLIGTGLSNARIAPDRP